MENLYLYQIARAFENVIFVLHYHSIARTALLGTPKKGI